MRLLDRCYIDVDAIALGLCVVLALSSECLAETAVSAGFEAMRYNNPAAVYFLKGGLFGRLAVGDLKNDGGRDIAIWCGEPGKEPWSGGYYFRSNAKDGSDPVLPPPERFAKSPWYPRVDCRGTDGKIIPRASIHPGRLRFNDWQLADLDGDGIDDCLVNVGDVSNDGFWTPNNYDASGKWLAGIGDGFMYWLKGLGGKGRDARYAAPVRLNATDGKPLWTACNTGTLVRDWDGDGDLDLIAFDFTDNITYFENVGTRTNPSYVRGRLLKDATGERLHGELCLPNPIAFDWDGDGRDDLMFTEEDSRVGWCRNVGAVRDGLPVFERVRFLRSKQDTLWFGSLATPCVFDWDGDGDQDIVCGNAAGQIAFIENLSGRGVEHPSWAPPVLLEAPPSLPIVGFASKKTKPEPIWIQAGCNGSIQGPMEAKWGYVCLTVADWDGDGLPDILANNIWGKLLLWRNAGTRTHPKLSAATGVEVAWNGIQPALQDGWYKPSVEANPKELIIPWRSTPVMTDWNGDGLMDLLALDHEGYLCFYRRERRDDGLVLLPPERVFWDDDRKIPLHPAYGPAPQGWKQGRGGGCGRRKMTLCDWDGDGKTDIVMNGPHNAVVYRQTGFADGRWHFACGKPLAQQELSSHDPQPAACDFNGDGVPDLVLGVVDGHLHYLKNPRLPIQVKEKTND